MTEDEIIIEFGAKIDKLIEGAKRSEEAVNHFKETSERAGEGLKKLAEAAGIAFSIEGIKLYIEHMAELGLQTERTMAMLGLTAEETGQLAGIAKLTGTSMEGLATSLERMSLNVQRSTRDAFNPAAQAMNVLGISAKQLIGVPTSEYIEKLHDAVSRFKPSLELTNAVMAVGGRGVAQMIPLLQLSGDKWKEMKAQITAAQDGLAAAIPGMADSHAKITLLSMSVQSLGARIFTVLKPAIDVLVTSLTSWIQKLDKEAIQGFATAAVDVLGNAIIKLIGVFYTFGTTLDEILSKLQRLFIGAALGGAVGLIGGGAGALLGAMFGGSIGLAYDAWVKQNEEGTKAASDSVDKSQEKLVARVKAMMAAITAAMTGGDTHGHGPTGATAGKIDEQAQARFQAQIAQIEGYNKLWQGWQKQQETIYQRDSDMWGISNQEKLRRSLSTEQKVYEAERQNLEAIAALYQSKGMLKEVTETNVKIEVLAQTHATEMIRINADMMRDIKSKWDEVFGGLQSAFNAQLRGLLAGTTSWKQAFKSVLGDMLIFFIQMVEKMVFQWIAGKLAMAAVDSTEVAKSVATQTAAAEATLPIRIAKFTSDLTAAAAIAFANTFAALAIFGPEVAGPGAAAAQATVLAQAVAVPKFAVGTDYVPYTGLAMVHEGEKIVTAEDNRKGNSGGGNISISIQAWDGASVAMWLKRGGAQMLAKHVGKAMTDQRSSRPTY